MNSQRLQIEYMKQFRQLTISNYLPTEADSLLLLKISEEIDRCNQLLRDSLQSVTAPLIFTF